MHINLRKLKITNFKGISSCEVDGFKRYNVFVGANGAGKSSLLSVIAYFIPLLRNKAVFQDGAFRFADKESELPLSLTYEFELVLTPSNIGFTSWPEALETLTKWGLRLEGTGPQEQTFMAKFHIQGIRSETGKSKGFLANSSAGESRSELSIYQSGKWIKSQEFLDRIRSYESFPDVRIRVAVIGTQLYPSVKHESSEEEKRSHAATLEGPQIGLFDALKAKLMQVLKNDEYAEDIHKHCPNLIKQVLDDYEQLCGYRMFEEIDIGTGEKPLLKRSDNTWQLWDSVSGGERVLFEFVALKLISEPEYAPIILIEEPENGVHVGLQTQLLKRLHSAAKAGQLFITTHSTAFLEIDENESETCHWLVSRTPEQVECIDVTNLTPTRVLSQLGVTARSIGQPKFRFLVEGISDAIFFQACFEKMSAQFGGSEKLYSQLEFVSCGGPDTIRKYGLVESEVSPGIYAEQLEKKIRAKINLARPGVIKQWILFDADGDEARARGVFQELKNRFGNQQTIEVIEPWYWTLESLYDQELWKIAYPRKTFRQETIPDRFWIDPLETLSHIMEKPPNKKSLNNKKTEAAFKIAQYIRESDWFEGHKKEFEALCNVISTIFHCDGETSEL